MLPFARFGTQWAERLHILRQSSKLIEALQCEISTAFAIFSTQIRLSECTISQKLEHISSSVASNWRHSLASSSKDSLPQFNSQTQNLTGTFDGEEDPYISSHSSCITLPDFPLPQFNIKSLALQCSLYLTYSLLSCQ